MSALLSMHSALINFIDTKASLGLFTRVSPQSHVYNWTKPRELMYNKTPSRFHKTSPGSCHWRSESETRWSRWPAMDGVIARSDINCKHLLVHCIVSSIPVEVFKPHWVCQSRSFDKSNHLTPVLFICRCNSNVISS